MRTLLKLAAFVALTLTSCKCHDDVLRPEVSGPDGNGVMVDASGGNQTRQTDIVLQKKFRQLLRRWDKHMESRRVILSSRIEESLNCKAYRDIVDLGKPALPMIIEEMRQGNDFLFFAVRDITGVTPDDLKQELDAQSCTTRGWDFVNITDLYIQWWDMKASHELSP